MVLDNATFHHQPRVMALFLSMGVRVMHLEPCDPASSPIEAAFNQVKAGLRRDLDCFGHSVSDDMMDAILTACLARVTATNAENYFRNAGFQVRTEPTEQFLAAAAVIIGGSALAIARGAPL